MEKQLIIRPDGDAARVMEEVILDSYRRLIGPAIEREIRAGLTETAENGAIQVFGKNLEQLLMQPPIAGCVVLGWDPAFRTAASWQLWMRREKCSIRRSFTRLRRRTAWKSRRRS